MEDETQAQQQVSTIWATSSSDVCKQCEMTATTGGSQSYVDLLTCLQAAYIAAHPDLPPGSWEQARTGINTKLIKSPQCLERHDKRQELTKKALTVRTPLQPASLHCARLGRDLLGQVARPALGSVEGNDADWRRILAPEQVADQRNGRTLRKFYIFPCAFEGFCGCPCCCRACWFARWRP